MRNDCKVSPRFNLKSVSYLLYLNKFKYKPAFSVIGFTPPTSGGGRSSSLSLRLRRRFQHGGYDTGNRSVHCSPSRGELLASAVPRNG